MVTIKHIVLYMFFILLPCTQFYKW